MFLVACLQTITSKYSYNYGLFPDLLKKEEILLPVKQDGTPDYIYMDDYMNMQSSIIINEIKYLSSYKN